MQQYKFNTDEFLIIVVLPGLLLVKKERNILQYKAYNNIQHISDFEHNKHMLA